MSRTATKRRSRGQPEQRPPSIALSATPPNQPVSSTRGATIPAVVILPLRAFLGITFVYAGWQKLTDPGFLHPGAPTYIGSQLQGFSHSSPIAFLFHWFALPFPVLVGVLTILTEIAIGLLVLSGLYTRPAAVVGLTLNLIFFLSASWNTYPYFYGSDIVFVMCWLTLLLTGPGPYALDTVLGQRRPAVIGSYSMVPFRKSSAGTVSRTELLLAGAGTVALIILGLLPRSRSGSHALATTAPKSAAKTVSGGSGTPAAPPGYQYVGKVSQIPVNSAATLTDPKSNDPAIIVRLANSQVVAYDAVCTHTGCTVEYDPQYKLLVCPCHGGAFDPAHGAAVVGGPPPAPLASIPLKVDAQGHIFVA